MISPEDNVEYNSEEVSSFESFASEYTSSCSYSFHSNNSNSSYYSDSDNQNYSSSDLGSDFDEEFYLNNEEYDKPSSPWLSGALRLRNRFGSSMKKINQSPSPLVSKKETLYRRPRNSRNMIQIKLSYLQPSNLTSNLITRQSSTILIFSVVIWLYIQFHFVLVHEKNPSLNIHDNQLEIDLPQLKEEAAWFLGPPKTTKKKQRRDRTHGAVDKLPNGCSPTAWHRLSFPTCNDIHEIDLRKDLSLKQKRSVRIPVDLSSGDNSGNWTSEENGFSNKLGYLGSGLWRQVWKVDPRNEGLDVGRNMEYQQAVIKVMKSEHNVDARNFDRHRRDALVMERLTSSNHIVSIYSFCGNTVLTEYAGISLDELIYNTDINDNDRGVKTNHYGDNYSLNNSKGRIHLALDVMRGIEAIHEILDGPVLHADVQAKQFLFDPVKGVKLNDFNRCRFLPRSDKTGQSCKVKIPSAPGGHRSPEEYEHYKVDEKIDIFSTANVLFAILTREKAWNTSKKLEIAKGVMKGTRPQIKQKYREPGSLDAALAEIILKAYNADPKQRPTAKQSVEILSHLLGLKIL